MNFVSHFRLLSHLLRPQEMETLPSEDQEVLVLATLASLFIGSAMEEQIFKSLCQLKQFGMTPKSETTFYFGRKRGRLTRIRATRSRNILFFRLRKLHPPRTPPGRPPENPLHSRLQFRRLPAPLGPAPPVLQTSVGIGGRRKLLPRLRPRIFPKQKFCGVLSAVSKPAESMGRGVSVPGDRPGFQRSLKGSLNQPRSHLTWRALTPSIKATSKSWLGTRTPSFFSSISVTGCSSSTTSWPFSRPFFGA